MKAATKIKPEDKRLEAHFKIQKWLIIISTLTIALFLFAILGIVLHQLGIIQSTLTIIKVAMQPSPTLPHYEFPCRNQSPIYPETTISPFKATEGNFNDSKKTPETTTISIVTTTESGRSSGFATPSTFDNEPPKFVVNTRGCRIPYIDPHNPSTWGYITQDREAADNKHERRALIATNNTAVFVNPETRGLYYNASDVADCCWRPYWRSKIRDNRVIPTRDCHPFEEAAAVHFDYIHVQCRLRNNSIYNDYFATVPKKPVVELRSQKLAALYNPKKKLSVLIIGKHATSRLGLRRFMPNTLRALQKIGAVEMLGYSRVSGGMYDNLVPLLTGLADFKLNDFRLNNFNRTFDLSPFLWREFASRGYRTIFAEDNCTMSTFNYLKPGFRMQPTDYYLRPLCLAALPKIGEADKCFTNVCEGSRFMTNRLMEYTLTVATEFAYKPYFGFFWQINTNDGFDEAAQLDDEAYYKLLMNLHDRNLLKNTALVFLSDLGDRWNPFKWTYQGQLEQKMPFAFMSLPDWWKEQNPDAWKALKKNAERLTTPFDVHEALMDILNPNRNIPNIETNEVPQISNGPGVSLFTPIPENRTCYDARISEDSCTCHHRHEISNDIKKLSKLSDLLIYEINSMISQEPNCAKLKISSIINVEALTSNDLFYTKEKKKGVDYRVTIQTQPGNGIFQSVIRDRVNATMKLSGPITRLDTYAKQSVCVKNFNLRFFCYCLETNEIL